MGKKKKRGLTARLFLFCFYIGLIFFLGCLLFAGGVYFNLKRMSFDAKMVKKVSARIEILKKQSPSKIVWRGEEFKQYVGKTRVEKLDLRDLPSHLVKALLASEHSDFAKKPLSLWKTRGCNPMNLQGKLRLVYGLIRYRKILGGGSGLPEQLSKNILKFKRTKISGKLPKIRQKLTEIARAWHLCRTYSNQDILWLYLKTAAFIPRDRYGISAGCHYQFGKPCSKLTPYESADLVLNLPNPWKFNVYRGPSWKVEKIRAGRRAYVLKQMREKFGIVVKPHPLTYKNNLKTSVSKDEDLPFLEAVIQELLDRGFALQPGWRMGGYKIVLNASKESHSQLKKITTQQFQKWNEWLQTDSTNPVKGAVIIANHKGEILFRWGGGDYVDRTNRAYHPGSVPKYLALVSGQHYPQTWPVFNGESLDENGATCIDPKKQVCTQSFSYKWEGGRSSVKNDHTMKKFLPIERVLPESANVASTVLLVRSHLLLTDEEFNKRRLIAMNWALRKNKRGCRIYRRYKAEVILEDAKLHFKFIRDCYGLIGVASQALQEQTVSYVLRQHQANASLDEETKNALAELLAKGTTSNVSLQESYKRIKEALELRPIDTLTWDPEIRLAHVLRWLIATGETHLGLERGHRPLPSIILGGQGFTTQELARMYSCIVGGDITPPTCMTPHLINQVRSNGTSVTLQKPKSTKAEGMGLDKIKIHLLKTVQNGGTAAGSKKMLGELAEKVLFKTGTGQNNGSIACAGGLSFANGFLTISIVAARDKVKNPLCKGSRCLWGSSACKLAAKLLKEAAKNLPLKPHREEEDKEENKEENGVDDNEDVPPPPPPVKTE